MGSVKYVLHLLSILNEQLPNIHIGHGQYTNLLQSLKIPLHNSCIYHEPLFTSLMEAYRTIVLEHNRKSDFCGMLFTLLVVLNVSLIGVMPSVTMELPSLIAARRQHTNKTHHYRCRTYYTIYVPPCKSLP